MLMVMVHFVWLNIPGHHRPRGTTVGRGERGDPRRRQQQRGRGTVILGEILETAEGREACWRSLNVAGVGAGYLSVWV